MSELDLTVNTIFDRRKSRDQELLSLLSAPDDLISLVLRGHLIVEELMFGAIAVHCAYPDHLKNAKLRFPQMAALLRSLDKLPSVPPKTWIAVAELNALRNSLAHTLEPKDVADRAEKFVAALCISDKLETANSPLERFKFSLHYLIGNLSAAAAFQGALEAVIQHRIGSGDEP